MGWWRDVFGNWQFVGTYASLLVLMTYRAVGWAVHGDPPDFETLRQSGWQGPFWGSVLILGHLALGPLLVYDPLPKGFPKVVALASIAATIGGVSGGILGLVEIRVAKTGSPRAIAATRAVLWILTLALVFIAATVFHKAHSLGYT